MKKIIAYVAVLLTTIFFSCSKNDSGNVTTHQYSAGIRVIVSQEFYNNGGYTDSLIAGADVDVYESEEDRNLNLTPNYSKSTGVNGVAEFYNLDKSYYYLRITNPVTHHVMKDETNTPDGSISVVQVIFD